MIFARCSGRQRNEESEVTPKSKVGERAVIAQNCAFGYRQRGPGRMPWMNFSFKSRPFVFGAPGVLRAVTYVGSRRDGSGTTSCLWQDAHPPIINCPTTGLEPIEGGASCSQHQASGGKSKSAPSGDAHPVGFRGRCAGYVDLDVPDGVDGGTERQVFKPQTRPASANQRSKDILSPQLDNTAGLGGFGCVSWKPPRQAKWRVP